MKHFGNSSVYWAQINFIMGGTIGFTQIKNGKRESYHRWTNVMPSLFESYHFHFPESPEAMEEYIRKWEEPYRNMQDDWERNGPDGPFENNMTDAYFGPHIPRFAPEHYGLIVVDFDEKKVYSCQGYSSFGVFINSIDIPYYLMVKAHQRGETQIQLQKDEIEWLMNDLKPYFDNGKLKLHYYTNVNEDGSLKPLYHMDNYPERMNAVPPYMKEWPLDGVKWLDDFSHDLGVYPSRLPGEHADLRDEDWFKRNQATHPKDALKAVELIYQERGKSSEERSYGQYDYELQPRLDFKLSVDSEWEFFRYKESPKGFKQFMQDMDEKYGLTEEDKADWKDFIEEPEEVSE